MKVFISAHELSPIQGSECRSAWNILTRLSFKHELTIFCAETNQFETANYKNQIHSHESSFHVQTKIVFIKQPLMTKFISKINKFLFGKRSNIGNNILYFAGVRFWEKSLFKYIKQNYSDSNLPDLFHHFNHISFREPGYCWKLKVPFIWGPVSGMVTPPRNFINSLDSSLRRKIIFRESINVIQSKCDYRIRDASKKSSHIFCVGHDDYVFFKNLSKNISFMSDMGTDPDNRLTNNKNLKKEKLIVSMIGRLDHLKAPHIALECFNSSKKIRDNAILQIIGDGHLKNYLHDRYSEYLGDSVIWYGKIPYEKVRKKLSNSDLLIHPSIKEAGSAVILEALEQCVPVICHDAFGMSHTINSTCGIKISMYSTEVSISKFKDALENLIDNRDLIEELIKGASIRSQELSWDNMADSISKKYIYAANK